MGKVKSIKRGELNMGYEESLWHARDLLVEEIKALRQQLLLKEEQLRRLNSVLRDPIHKRGSGTVSLTKQILTTIYQMSRDRTHPISAKQIVREFRKQRHDVNESTIRSTLYQVSRKQKATEIECEGWLLEVKLLKEGPWYMLEVLGQYPLEEQIDQIND